MTRIYIDVGVENNLIPVKVQNVSAIETTDTVTISWDELTGYDISTYEVWKKTNEGEWVLLDGAIAFGTTSKIDASVADGNTYYYKVRGKNAEGQYTGYSDVASITLSADATAPGAPTGLTATAISDTEIDLSWTAPTDNGGATITGYKIERRLSGGSFSVLVADTGTSTTTYADSGLTAETTYEYRVSAINSIGTGAASNIASATTESSKLAAPSNFDTGNIYSFGFTTNWDDVPNSESYTWEISTDNFATIEQTGEIESAYKTIHNLLPSTNYKFRIKATTSDINYNDSDWSTIDVATVVQETEIALQRINELQFTSKGRHKDKVIGLEIYVNSGYLSNPTANPGYGLFAHGAGEYSDSSSGPNFSILRGAPSWSQYFNNGGDKPYIFLSPQLPIFQNDWTAELICEILNFAKSVIPNLNTDAVNISGWSNGKAPWQFFRAFPERTKTCIPFAVAGDNPTGAEAGAVLADGAKVWIFHNENDGTVSPGGSIVTFQDMIDSGATSEQVRMTLYNFSTNPHNCVSMTIDLTGGSIGTANPGYTYTPYPNTGGTYENIDEFMMAT